MLGLTKSFTKEKEIMQNGIQKNIHHILWHYYLAILIFKLTDIKVIPVL